jgi:glutathione S-transferase
MIRILGRSTSGNVQKVLLFLEEVGLKYTREDYGRQFNNTNTESYRKLNPNMKVPTLVDGDLVAWESHTILRYLAALHAPHLTGATPAERTHVERWMDWNLGALNTPYVAVFKDAKKPEAERAADFAAQSADLIAPEDSGWLHCRQVVVCARSVDARRYLSRPGCRALSRLPHREAGLGGADAMDEGD